MNRSIAQRLAELEERTPAVQKPCPFELKPGQAAIVGDKDGAVFVFPDNGRGPQTGKAAQNGE